MLLYLYFNISTCEQDMKYLKIIVFSLIFWNSISTLEAEEETNSETPRDISEENVPRNRTKKYSLPSLFYPPLQSYPYPYSSDFQPAPSDTYDSLSCSRDATCTTMQHCVADGGIPTSYCNLYFYTGICCVRREFCKQVSSADTAVFQNPNYPQMNKDPLNCVFTLNVKKNTCGVRIDFVEAVFAPVVDEGCVQDIVLILNGNKRAEGYNTPFCGEIDGFSTVIMTPKQTELKVVVNTQNADGSLWNIKLAQINCSQPTLPEEDACGIRNRNLEVSTFPGALSGQTRDSMVSASNVVSPVISPQNPIANPPFNQNFNKATLPTPQNIPGNVAPTGVVTQTPLVNNNVPFEGRPFPTDENFVPTRDVTQTPVVNNNVPFEGRPFSTNENPAVNIIRPVEGGLINNFAGRQNEQIPSSTVGNVPPIEQRPLLPGDGNVALPVGEEPENTAFDNRRKRMIPKRFIPHQVSPSLSSSSRSIISDGGFNEYFQEHDAYNYGYKTHKRQADQFNGPEHLTSQITVNDTILTVEQAQPNQFPWMAALLLDGVIHCAGALISKDWILTAAHCVVITSPTPIIARLRALLGSHNVTNVDEPRRVLKTISNIVRHPQYHGRKYDIALLKLSTSVQYSVAIRPACLPEDTDEEYSSTGAIMAGWGSVNGLNMSTVLNVAVVPIINSTQCAPAWEENDVGIEEYMICASPNGTATCIGDIGGPLVVEKENGLYGIIGILSFGAKPACHGVLTPDVFIRTTPFLDWLSIVLVENGKKK